MFLRVNPDISYVGFSGGGALNKTLVSMLEYRLSCKLHVPGHPQITGAIGAALSGK